MLSRFINIENHPALSLVTVVVGIALAILASAPLFYYLDRWIAYWSPQ
jgi:peptidoglycan/LPS O-acetylase OafA/YrhL